MGGIVNGIGSAVGGYLRDRFGNPLNPSSSQAQDMQMRRMKSGGILGAISQGVNRYRAAQQQAQQNGMSPANSMDMSPVANPQPPTQADPSQPTGYADEIGGPSAMSSQSSNSYSSPGAADYDAGDAFSGSMDGIPEYGSGAIVTKPTIALVGEKSPEMVVPLLSQPGQKVDSTMLGQGLGMRSRFRRPTGPNASARYKPVSADIPLRPSGVNR